MEGVSKKLLPSKWDEPQKQFGLTAYYRLKQLTGSYISLLDYILVLQFLLDGFMKIRDMK